MIIATLAIGHDFCKNLIGCLDSKKDYADRHAYKYIQGGHEFWDRTRPIPWSKIPFILSILTDLEDGKLVWLSDADVLITNPALSLETHILPMLPAEKDMLMFIDACGNLNSGNLLMRNSAWLRDYWKRVGEQTDLLYHIWWENAAMIKLLETNADDLAHVEISGLHTRFNSYIQGLPGQPLWKPGHFLVHFAGIYDINQIKNLTEAIQTGRIPRLVSQKIEYININERHG
jgi:hypothetical protein